jgi:hypothetical protein
MVARGMAGRPPPPAPPGEPGTRWRVPGPGPDAATFHTGFTRRDASVSPRELGGILVNQMTVVKQEIFVCSIDCGVAM